MLGDTLCIVHGTIVLGKHTLAHGIKLAIPPLCAFPGLPIDEAAPLPEAPAPAAARPERPREAAPPAASSGPLAERLLAAKRQRDKGE